MVSWRVVLLLSAVSGCGVDDLQSIQATDGGLWSQPQAMLADPSPYEVSEEEIYSGYERLREDSFVHETVLAIIEGTVVATSVELLPTSDIEHPWFIATRYSLQISRAWKSGVSGTIELWSYGGRLADDVPIGPYPRGRIFSRELYPDVDSTLIAAVAEQQLFPGDVARLRVINGETGAVRTLLPQQARPRAYQAIGNLRNFLDNRFP